MIEYVGMMLVSGWSRIGSLGFQVRRAGGGSFLRHDKRRMERGLVDGDASR